jgi:Ca-activated chloride channel family protein
MKFAEPLWLLAGLIGCGVLLWTWCRYDARQRAALATFASAHLHAQLIASFSTTARNWKRGLFLAAVAGLFVALARPQAGFRWDEVKRRGIEVVFAVDVSRSMLTPDVKPDRLTRAKLAVDDFVRHLDGDGVGLIAFAGDAFLQCPITLDYDAFNETLQALDPTIIPRGGTDIASAIHEAQAALQNRPGTDKILVLLTDGEDLEGSALEAAKAAGKSGLKIYTVGVGTAGGDLIPLPADQGGGFVKDDAGQFVKSHLDESGLKAIAAATDGLYAPLGTQGQGLDTIYREALAPLKKHDLASRRQKIAIDRFQWPLGAGLLFLLASLPIGTRRRRPRAAVTASTPSRARGPLGAAGTATVLGLLMLVPGPRAHASPTTAEAAYQKGDFVTAQKEYTAAAQTNAKQPELEFNAGAAAYKAGQFPVAAAAFQKSLVANPSADPQRLATQESAYYNLGNTLYRTGQKTERSKPEETIKTWEQAVKTYDAALQLKAKDADAQYNRDFVQKKLDALKKQQQQKKQGEKDQQDKQDQKQDQQNQSGQKPDDKPQQKSDQSQQAGQNTPDKNQNQKDQGTGDQPKADQPKNNDGAKPDQPKTDGQDKDQPKPGQGQPQANAQNQASPDQNAGSAADAQREPGQMSKDEARSLLDSLKGEEQKLPVAPVTRGPASPASDKPTKDW